MSRESFHKLIVDSHPRTGPFLDEALAEARRINAEQERRRHERRRGTAHWMGEDRRHAFRREADEQAFKAYIRNVFDAEGTR